MGLPEELTEEEKAKEAAAAAQKAEAAKKKGSFVTVKPVSGRHPAAVDRAWLLGAWRSCTCTSCQSLLVMRVLMCPGGFA